MQKDITFKQGVGGGRGVPWVGSSVAHFCTCMLYSAVVSGSGWCGPAFMQQTVLKGGLQPCQLQCCYVRVSAVLLLPVVVCAGLI
jgi:hypothetical protein